jgi:hypothetical protein
VSPDGEDPENMGWFKFFVKISETKIQKFHLNS